jgi:hypothetical protein
MTAPYPVFKATSLPDFQSANATPKHFIRIAEDSTPSE